MQTDERRRVRFEGAVNFRDLGGYRAGAGRQTRWGRVYRADNLAGLTEADVVRLAELGLKTLIDFRLPLERVASPDRLPAGLSMS
jgi:protein-tyrosine phosphatase